jgi:hypothetical protein
MKRSLRIALSVLVLPNLASLLEAQSPRAAHPPSRDVASWGGSDRVLYHVGAFEFEPVSSSQGFDTGPGRYSTPSGGFFVASLHLPSGARLTYFELDYVDSVALGNQVTLSLNVCNFLGTSCTTYGPLESNNGPVGSNFITTDLTFNNIVVDNNGFAYDVVANTQSGNSANQILGAYIGYKLEVSPAPVSATFSDVPTTHPFFRFVEALSRSGITAGCGGGNFCPDDPITRGQMAVFLAAALGLHFPN